MIAARAVPSQTAGKKKCLDGLLTTHLGFQGVGRSIRAFAVGGAAANPPENSSAAVAEPFYGSPRPPPTSSPPWSFTGMASRGPRLLLEQLSFPPSSPQQQQSDDNSNAQRSSGASTTHAPGNSSRGRFDRVALTLQQAAIALRDPTRADAVAAVGELTGTLALRQLQTVMRNDPVGRQILQERPIVSKATIPYEQLLELGAKATEKMAAQQGGGGDGDDDASSLLTLGEAYGQFLHTHGFDPDERDEVRYLHEEDEELAYIMLRYRQSHDFYHALTGLPPTVLGELALKWLELFQTGLPMTAFAGTVGGFFSLPTWEERRQLWTIHIPWAQQTAARMPFGALLTIYYEREWDTPLVELRQRLGMISTTANTNNKEQTQVPIKAKTQYKQK